MPGGKIKVYSLCIYVDVYRYVYVSTTTNMFFFTPGLFV